MNKQLQDIFNHITNPNTPADARFSLLKAELVAIFSDIEKRCKAAEKQKAQKAKTLSPDALIANYTTNSMLAETLREFVKMRTLIKKPLTSRALELIFSKLNKLAAVSDERKIAILNESILNCWQDIYAPKAAGGKARNYDGEE